jgi:hypothetical protein
MRAVDRLTFPPRGKTLRFRACTFLLFLSGLHSIKPLEKMKRPWHANVRNFVIYDFEGKAPRSLYALRGRLESQGLARWIQYSVVETQRLDVALQIARFCRERGAKVRVIRGAEYELDCERSH